MEENDNHGSGINQGSGGSPESPCSKNGSHEGKNTNSRSSNSSNSNREQDRFLPIANVGRIMKKVIPGNGKISKDAKEVVQECVSEFISFVTGEASDKCQREKRKTINGDDIIWAITTLGFEDYVNPLKLYLLRYRDMEGEKLNIPKQAGLEQRQQPHHVALDSDNSPTDYTSHHSMFYANQPFSVPFSPNAIQQLQQHE